MTTDTKNNKPNERKTEVKSISFDPYTAKKVDKLAKDGEFGTFSGVVVTAVIEFLTKLELEKDNESAMALLVKILQTPEGLAALEKIKTTNSEKKDDQKKDNNYELTDDINRYEYYE